MLSDDELVTLAQKVVDARAAWESWKGSGNQSEGQLHALIDAREALADTVDERVLLALMERVQRAESAERAAFIAGVGRVRHDAPQEDAETLADEYFATEAL